MSRSLIASMRALLAVSAIALTPAAIAQETATGAEIRPPVPVEGEIGRFTFSSVVDGLMRLDSRTGQVSHCRRRGPSWSCETVADDRAAYEAEIARLAGKVAALEAGAQPVPPVPPQSVPPSASKPDAPWLGDEEVERAMRYLEGLFRRFLTMVDKLWGESDRI